MITFKETKDILFGMIENAFMIALLNEKETFEKIIESGQPVENSMVMMFSVVSMALDKVYADLEEYNEGIDLDVSTESSLDNLGKIMGLKRPEGSKCYADLLFTLDYPQAENKTIPKSVNFTSTTGKVYELVEDILIPIGQTEVRARCYSKEIGFDEIVPADSLIYASKELSKYTGTHTTVTNPEIATGGTYRATDEEYRDILLEAYLNHELGSEGSFDLFFENLDGLDDHKLIPQWDGAGGMKLIIKPYDDDFIKDVEKKIKKTMFYNDGLRIEAPKERLIDLYLNVNVDIGKLNIRSNEQKEEIKSRIIEAVKVYFNGGFRVSRVKHKGIGIGKDFIPFQLALFISQEVADIQDVKISPDARIVNDSETLFKFGDVNVEIE